MNRFVRLLMIFFFAAAAAIAAPRQEPESERGEQRTGETSPEAEAAGADDREETAETRPARRRRQRPRVDSSNTGYIDNAVVGTQWRLRLDSGHGANRPDRAEFIYGKCLCFTAAGQDGASPGPTRDLDTREIALSYERAFADRWSLFVEVPFRSVKIAYPEGWEAFWGGPGVDNSGLGDVRPGLKYALSSREGHHLTFQLKGYLATGESADGLGTGHDSIEPGLLYLFSGEGPYALAAELRWWHPLGGSSDPVSGEDNHDFAGDVLRFGFGASRDAVGSGVSVSPVAEVVGWYVRDSFATADVPFPPDNPIERTGGDLILNLKLGARVRTAGPGSLYVGYGLPLTGHEWYDGIFRLEYRFAG